MTEENTQDDVEKSDVVVSGGDDVKKVRPARISVALTSTSHLKLLKSVNELNEENIDHATMEDLQQKEEDNKIFIQGLQNPMKYKDSL